MRVDRRRKRRSTSLRRARRYDRVARASKFASRARTICLRPNLSTLARHIKFNCRGSR